MSQAEVNSDLCMSPPDGTWSVHNELEGHCSAHIGQVSTLQLAQTGTLIVCLGWVGGHRLNRSWRPTSSITARHSSFPSKLTHLEAVWGVLTTAACAVDKQKFAVSGTVDLALL